jgi:hypothetical protein
MKCEVNFSIEEVRFVSEEGDIVGLTLGTLSDDIKKQLMLHGLKQKLGDAAAMSRDPVTGKSASEGEKLLAIREVADMLLSGNWTKPRGASNLDSDLVKALIELKGEDKAQAIRAAVKGWDKAQKLAVSLKPEVAAIIQRLQSAKTSSIDVDDMLSDL